MLAPLTVAPFQWGARQRLQVVYPIDRMTDARGAGGFLEEKIKGWARASALGFSLSFFFLSFALPSLFQSRRAGPWTPPFLFGGGFLGPALYFPLVVGLVQGRPKRVSAYVLVQTVGGAPFR